MTPITRKEAARLDHTQAVHFPIRLLNSAVIAACSGSEIKLLLHLAQQYDGCNNGTLISPWDLMQSHGWSSKTTLSNALKGLQEAGLIYCTNPSATRGSWRFYALSWWPLDVPQGHRPA